VTAPWVLQSTEAGISTEMVDSATTLLAGVALALYPVYKALNSALIKVNLAVKKDRFYPVKSAKLVTPKVKPLFKALLASMMSMLALKLLYFTRKES
jgi:hypothetical protein